MTNNKLPNETEVDKKLRYQKEYAKACLNPITNEFSQVWIINKEK